MRDDLLLAPINSLEILQKYNKNNILSTKKGLKLFGAKIHSDYGIGARVLSLAHPLSFGVANSIDGWKLFSNVSVVF